ncbi:autotransporter assembly complex protein TamA [Roseovarius sp. C7]|uniref:autotransporter assembly complex protein TamA n=1 Tax=Roseovarius sp. C7 TaxID=3398643 RepID=UPI0039F6DD89
MKDSADRLRRTGAFRSVVFKEAEEIGPGNTLPVTVEVTDAKPRRFGFGAELSSLEGITLSTFWLHRNLWGGAERLRIEGEVSGIGGDTGGIDYVLSARLDRPAIFTPDTSHYFDFRLQELDEPDYQERSLRIGTGLSHIFNDDLTGELGIAYQYSEIEDDLGDRTREHLLFPGKLTFDNRDDPLDATKGVYLGLEVTPFLGLSDSGGGARIYSDARSYFALGRDDAVVLAGRAQLGTVTGADLADVPADMLFYSGGAGTVRGQPYQSLAVDLGGGNRIGGRSFMAFSAEIRAAVARKFEVVGFADTGYVGRDSFGSGTGTWHSGAGLGLRYDTGIGPIRVDVATPLDDDAGEDFELYIGIGQAF